MKIAIDAMGGDFAPLEIVLGALEAVRETEHIDVVLVGDKTQIFKILEDNNFAILSVVKDYGGNDRVVLAKKAIKADNFEEIEEEEDVDLS